MAEEGEGKEKEERGERGERGKEDERSRFRRCDRGVSEREEALLLPFPSGNGSGKALKACPIGEGR